MAKHLRTLDDVLTRLESAAAPLVVPSNRAASAIRRAFDRRQRSAGRRAWAPADVYSWSQWTSALWTRLLLAGYDDRIILNSAQEQLLWRDIIAADPNTSALASAEALATLAQSALALAARYSAEAKLRPTPAMAADVRAFSHWREEFLRRCDRDRWLAPSLLDAALEAHAQDLTPPTRIDLLGFHEIAPSQQKLLEALDRAGATVDLITLTTPTTHTRSLFELPDEPEELRAAATWLRDQLAANLDTDAALILPNPAAEWPALEPLLREILAPGLLHTAADPLATPWDGDTGATLNTLPVIAAALDLLAWTRAALPLDRISAIFLNPWFSAVPTEDRARFDSSVLARQNLLRPELGLREALRLAREKSTPALTDFLNALAITADRYTSAPPRQTYARWTETFRDILAAAGWASDPNLTINERSIAEAFEAVLDLVSTLDFAAARVTFADALDAVRRQCAQTPLPSDRIARLHILRPAQAIGIPLDAALVLHATEAVLDATPRTHPLLDWSVQRSSGMPGTDPARDRESTIRLYEALAESTPDLAFTRALATGHGHTQPSSIPLALGCKIHKPKASIDLHASADPDPLETEADDTLPPIPSREVPGGARVLQLQAACGFLAFAEIRLGGRDAIPQSPGFDAIESGNVLHRALDLFWSEVQTQDALRAMTFPAREDALTRAIDKSIRTQPGSPWDTAYIALTKERMLKVLRRWLDFELTRTPFRVVSTEHKTTLPVGPLDLAVVVDRVDQLPDEGVVFIDYKTGATAKPAAWTGDRPDQPQLPLYSLLAPAEDLRGLAFARVRTGKDMQWAGYASDHGDNPSSAWEARDLIAETEAWRSTLTTLAENFANGLNDVAPKDYTVNCTRCAQRLLCRLDVTSLMQSDSAAEEDADV